MLASHGCRLMETEQQECESSVAFRVVSKICKEIGTSGLLLARLLEECVLVMLPFLWGPENRDV